MLHYGVRRFAVLLLFGGLCLADRPAAQSSDIDELIAKGTELASQQVRRADLAIPYFTRALALAEQAHESTRAALAAARLGAAYRSTHQVGAAFTVLERGAVLARDAHRPDLEGLCFRTIGNIHVEGGRYDVAGGYLERALAIADRTGDSSLKIATLNALSASARLQGRLADALDYARTALELLDAELAAGRKMDGAALFAIPFNVGKALSDGGDYAAALEYFERAFTAAQANNLIAGVWHALFDTAEWYQSQGDFDRAAAYYRRALEQGRKAESRDMEANTIRGLGSIAEERGDFADAIAQYTTALRLYETYGFGGWIPSTTAALARAQLKAGQPAQARATLAGALAKARSAGRPLHLARVLIETAATARAEGNFAAAARDYEAARILAADNGLRPTEAIAAAGLARVAHDRGDAPRALALYLRAEEAIGRLQARIPAPDQRATFSDAVHATFAGEFELLMDRAGREPGAGYDRLAFLALERERAQELTGALTDSRVDRGRSLPPALRERQGRAGRRLAEIQTELMLDEVPPDRRRALRAEQDDREREWESVWAAESASATASHPSAPVSSARVVEELQATLAPGEAFIEYATRHAFVVTRDAFRTVALPDVDGLAARADFFVRLLAGDDPAQAPVSGHLLSSTLIAPVQAVLPAGTQSLVVSATGAVAGLPFAALPDPGQAGSVPLLVRYEIAYTDSASALIRARRAPAAAGVRGLLAVANPPALASRAQLVTASLTRAGVLRPLPYAQDEVQRAAHASYRSHVLVGASATEYELKHLPLSDFSVLHFATHAVLDPVAPKRSAIVLGAGQGDDGLLQAREIFQLPLAADLVVLSACRTAAGRPSTAEGMRSLGRAFLYAGARSVLGTLWDVDDRSTARLMDRFYDRAARGQSAAAALRAAQLEGMGRDPYRNAPLWAAFVITGDGAVRIGILRPAPLVSRAMLVAVAAVAGVVLTAILVTGRRRRRSGAVMVS